IIAIICIHLGRQRELLHVREALVSSEAIIASVRGHGPKHRNQDQNATRKNNEYATLTSLHTPKSTAQPMPPESHLKIEEVLIPKQHYYAPSEWADKASNAI